MKMRASIITYAVTMAVLGFCPTALILADTPQEILSKAISNQHPQSFTATLATQDAKGSSSIAHISTYVVPDGTTETRSEIDTTIGKLTFHLIQITNSEGTWFLNRKTAVKAGFISNINSNAEAVTKASISAPATDATYTQEDAELNGTQCHVITQRISDAQLNQNVENTVKAVGDLVKGPGALQAVKDQVPAVTVYYIGTDDGFIYSTRKLNANGGSISDLTYKDVKFNIPLDPNIFKVPQDYKIVIAKTPQELAGFMASSMK